MIIHSLLFVLFPITQAFQFRNPVRLCRTNCQSKPVKSNSFVLKSYISEVEVPEKFIDDRTYECLDFEVILDVLQNSTVTVQGNEICRQKISNTSEAVRNDYAKVEQILGEIAFLPLRTSMNIFPVLNAIEKNLSPPEREDLAAFTTHIEQIIELREYMTMQIEMDKLSLYIDLIADLELPKEFSEMFLESFDDEGNLNAEKYPIIKKYRQEIATLRGKIIQTLKSLLQSQDMRDKLADNGFQEIEGRYCLMLKNTYKKGVGIVHGSSNTGRSLYVEPIEIVEPTNEMKSLQAQLRAEEASILYDMCKSISTYREELKRSVAAVAEIDVYRAKAKIGEKIKGVIPEVYDEGVMRCIDARHPILTLRGVNPVGNDLYLNSSSVAWVISGPNAGGKTIILKTAGLYALMVRYSIPIPARRGARIDYMEVMADIGDMQTVSGDLSTFSGHLVVCREMLKKVHRCKEQKIQALVLLDEIGTGTDPAQGAALAQAVLEELINNDSRVIVTTHYQRIKELAVEDTRFRIAAMEFIDNKPTYKLRLGSVGESFALEAAQRMNLPQHVLTRANMLLDDETRRIVALQQRLEEETNRAQLKQKEYDNMIMSLLSQEEEIEKEKKRLEEQIEKIREGYTEEFIKDLKMKEKDLEVMLEEAKEALRENKSSQTEMNKMMDQVKSVVKKVRTETEKELVEVRAENLATPLEPGEKVDVGKILVILEKGNLFGLQGIVSQKDKGRGRLVLTVAGMEVKVERHLVGHPQRSGPLNMKPKDLLLLGGNLHDDNTLMKNISAKDRRMLKMLQEELVDPEKMLSKQKIVKNNAKLSGLKVQSNTLELKGKTLVEAQTLTMNYFEKLYDKIHDNKDNLPDKMSVIYIHLGKDNDELKIKYRTWLKNLPVVNRALPADSVDGGDAYTVVELNLVNS